MLFPTLSSFSPQTAAGGSLHLLALMLIAAPAARAQNVAMEGTLPDSIVVTATRQAESIRSAGRRVDVLTAADIAALPVSSVDELLRTVGGVEIQSRGGFGVQSDITMRGSTFNGVLVLLDGIRVNDPMTGHFFADLPMPLSEIARIEVLRGPGTVLYGPDAIGGVVQLFTYEGLRNAPSSRDQIGGSLALQVGDHALYKSSVAARAAVRASAMSIASTFEGTDGMDLYRNGEPVVGNDGPVRADFRRSAHTAALSRPLGGAQLFTRVGVDAREFGAYHFYTDSPSDTAREKTATLWAQARLEQAKGPLPWRVHAAARRHTDEYCFYPRLQPNKHTSSLYTVLGEAGTVLSNRVGLTAGATATARTIDSNNHGEHADVSAGVFSLFRFEMPLGIVVHAGGRLDYDPSYGIEPTPQISAAYSAGMLTLYAGGGRAIRAPNYVERYINTAIARPRGQNLGDPDLTPERAWTYEAGLDLYPASGFSMHAAVFNRTTDGLIDFAKVSSADTVWLARNLHRVVTRGVELDGKMSQSFRFGRLRAGASYALLDATLRRPDPTVTYKYALSNARHLVQGTASLEVGDASLGAQMLWKDPLEGNPYQTVSYAVFNASLGYRIYWGRQRLVLSAELRNIFDQAYYELFDAPMPGRWWIVGVTLAR